MIVRSWMDYVFAYGRSVLHPRTLFRTIVALFIGFFTLISRAVVYAKADELKELREKNPTAWDTERARRRWYLWAGVGIDLFVLLATVYVRAKYTWMFDLQRFGPLLWMLTHIAFFIWLGRQEPILARVQTKRMMGEELIRTVSDEMTLSQAARKEGATTEIAIPPHSLKRVKGYSVTVRVHQVGNPLPLLTDVPRLAHKLHKGNGHIFTYQERNDNSLIRWVVLDRNPWESPPSRHPLIEHPRRFNIWQEKADLGLLPDFSEWLKVLITEGEGGGILIGGAPRQGKSVFIKDLLVYLILDPVNNIHMIDGKSLDFPDIKPIAETYIGDKTIEDIELLRKSAAFLEGMKREINRRKGLLQIEEADHVTEELCRKLNLRLEWIVIDELAVITEDLRTKYAKEVLEFIDLLQYIVRMGPAFGVFCILATQRPSDKSVPDSIRSLIIFKVAFYISTQAGSLAITGKAGPNYRADWLDSTLRGVGISVGEGQIRPHFVTKADFKMICRFARALRAGEIKQEETVSEYPELVKMILSLYESSEDTRIPTTVILEGLEALGVKHTAISLASAVRPFGFGPRNIKVGRVDAKGYRLEEVQAAPKITLRPVYTRPVADATTAGDRSEVWVATTEQETEDG